MFAVCRNCQRFLGRRAPLEQAEVINEVCSACAHRPALAGKAVVVVSRRRADTIGVLRALLKTAPEFEVVLDRRVGHRVPLGTRLSLSELRWPGPGPETGSSGD